MSFKEAEVTRDAAVAEHESVNFLVEARLKEEESARRAADSEAGGCLRTSTPPPPPRGVIENKHVPDIESSPPSPQGGVQNKQSTDVAYPPPLPRVCMSHRHQVSHAPTSLREPVLSDPAARLSGCVPPHSSTNRVTPLCD